MSVQENTNTEQDGFAPRMDMTALNQAVENVKAEVGKVIVGQEDLVEKLIIALLVNGHVLLEGMPGVAKTLSAKLLAKTVNAGFSRIQFTPDLMPSDVVGTMVYNAAKTTFDFKRGPIFSNIVLIDEINRAPAKTQSALFECMEEQQVTIDGVSHELPAPFMVIATQNPVDHEGTYRLPEAQLDRFLFKVTVDYPAIESEAEILNRHHTQKHVMTLETIAKVLTPDSLKEHAKTIGEVVVSKELIQYIAGIVHQTRNNNALYVGASPRASIAILESSKALAAVKGRDFVTPEDIKEVAPAVLNHRVSLTPEKEMEGRTSLDILSQLLEKVEVPR